MLRRFQMKKTLLWLLTLLSISSFSQEKPKLVVGIVVDQMKPDYLLRFGPNFTGGFKKMMERGTNFSNAHYSHVPTYTAPGHATIYSGAQPKDHGIISNGWFDPYLNREVYCVEDGEASLTGSHGAGRSPRNLKVTNIADQLKLGTDGKALVYGISIKDRGAILPAGHMADGAFWMNEACDLFVGSSHYSKEFPDFMQKFNDRKLPAKYMSQTWDLLLAVDKYTGDDYSEWERTMNSKNSPVFPYNLDEVSNHGEKLSEIKSTPYGNSILVELAKTIIDETNIGRDDITDLLAISFSSTDYSGHGFGPRSWELQDMYYRLDRDLDTLLSYLDQKIGKNNYVVFLTADHAGAENPGWMTERGFKYSAIGSNEIETSLRNQLKVEFGFDPILHFNPTEIHLKTDTLAILKLDQRTVFASVKRILLRNELYSDVYFKEDLALSTDRSAMMRYAGTDKRSGEILAKLSSGNMFYGRFGTTHGSDFTYDTQVPLLWYGMNITSANISEKVDVRSIAVSLAQLMGIALPSAAYADRLPISVKK